MPRNRASSPEVGELTSSVSIDVLRTLLAFSEAGGVSAAARRLRVSQPVVSRKLDALTRVETCGAILLVRDGGNLRLTEAGQASLPTIQELVRKFDQLRSFWSGALSSAATVSLAVGHFAAELYVPHALATLRQSHPECEVTTQVLRGSERILGTFDGRFDLAVVSHDAPQIAALLSKERGARASLNTTELVSPPMVVMARKQSREGGELAAVEPRKFVPLRTLTTWELVGLDASSGIRRQLESRLRTLRISASLSFVAEGGGWNAAREFARHGLGVAILPLPALRSGDDRDFTIRRLSDDFRLSEVVVHRGNLRGAAHDVVRSLCNAAEATLQEAESAWSRLFECTG